MAVRANGKSYWTLGVIILAGTILVTIVMMLIQMVNYPTGGLVIGACVGAILDG
jgi:hypothetical protein